MEILVQRKKLVQETKIPGKMVNLDGPFSPEKFGPDLEQRSEYEYDVYRNCCLRKGYGSALKVVSSIREPRYVTRKETQSPEVAGFP